MVWSAHEKPSQNEMIKFAKGLRTVSQVQEYFRQYRKDKKAKKEAEHVRRLVVVGSVRPFWQSVHSLWAPQGKAGGGGRATRPAWGPSQWANKQQVQQHVPGQYRA